VIGVADSVPVFQAWQVELTTATLSAGVAVIPPVGIRTRIPESRAWRRLAIMRALLHLGRSNNFPSDRQIVFAGELYRHAFARGAVLGRSGALSQHGWRVEPEAA
jgi:hypothetical protein